ncbi:alpha/beta hydrolase family protein [Staphylococcus pseudintermedius]
MESFKYGDKLDQFVDIYKYFDNQPIILIIHGGYWKQKYTKTLNDSMINFFLDKKINALSIEYRRGANKWPIPVKDVETCIKKLLSKKIIKDEYFIIIGHSVGGQIALLLNQYSDITIALAPVTDVVYTEKMKLGENIVPVYFNVLSNLALHLASPIYQKSLKLNKLLLIHGLNDKDVHIKSSNRFVQKFKGSQICYWKYKNLEHLECIENYELFENIYKYINNSLKITRDKDAHLLNRIEQYRYQQFCYTKPCT